MENSFRVNNQERKVRSTTVLCVRDDDHVVMIADGQVSLGHTVLKNNANKIRRLENRVLAGFAGSTADALTLFSRLESKLSQYRRELLRACVELAKDWRTDKVLRKLEAMLLVADKQSTYLVSGSGDIVEPEYGVATIGSGGQYALAAARVLMKHSSLSLEEIAKESMQMASEICVYTNDRFVIEKL